MAIIICLHGNPGIGKEFDHILSELQQENMQFHIHRRPLRGCRLEELFKDISLVIENGSSENVYFLTYSWGSYLALAYLTQYPNKVLKVFMVNPLVVDHKPIWRPLQLLLSIPLLDTLILKQFNRKRRRKLIEDIFFPDTPSIEVQRMLETFLSNIDVWKGAVIYKNIMYNYPLSKEIYSLPIPIKAVLGEKDILTPPKEQLPFLRKLSGFKAEIIAEGGHALMSTHPELVLEQIKSFFLE